MVQAPLTPEILMQHIPGLVKVEPCFDRGGFKTVYRALVEGKKEALKVIRIQQLDDPTTDTDLAGAIVGEQISRVRREIDALKKCQVPELVKLGSIRLTDFEIEGEKYVAYSEEFLEGDDLWKLIKMSTRPDLKELVLLFQTLLRCIKELWKHGFVHRDIKPANVIKTHYADRPFVLLDLGIAYAIHETSITFKMDGRLPPAACLFGQIPPCIVSSKIDFGSSSHLPS
jgi:serine/threonine protein kinase